MQTHSAKLQHSAVHRTYGNTELARQLLAVDRSRNVRTNNIFDLLDYGELSAGTPGADPFRGCSGECLVDRSKQGFPDTGSGTANVQRIRRCRPGRACSNENQK
jgi:hypothetical protein